MWFSPGGAVLREYRAVHTPVTPVTPVTPLWVESLFGEEGLVQMEV